METRRRVNVIASHFIPYDATATTTATATHLFPMNCSSMIQRRDNKTYFARQSSSSQACYMRPVSTQQEEGAPLHSTTTSLKHQPLFSRPTTKIPKPGTPTEPAQFSRPNTRIYGQKQLCCSKTKIHNLSTGSRWSPRLDVAESRRAFVVTVELPGVNVNDMRIEVTDKALNVKGNRISEGGRVKSDGPQNLIYHKKEILKGAFQVMWPLPPNVDKDSVSATFVDGFLQITIPRV